MGVQGRCGRQAGRREARGCGVGDGGGRWEGFPSFYDGEARGGVVASLVQHDASSTALA